MTHSTSIPNRKRSLAFRHTLLSIQELDERCPGDEIEDDDDQTFSHCSSSILTDFDSTLTGDTHDNTHHVFCGVEIARTGSSCATSTVIGVGTCLSEDDEDHGSSDKENGREYDDGSDSILDSEKPFSTNTSPAIQASAKSQSYESSRCFCGPCHPFVTSATCSSQEEDNNRIQRCLPSMDIIDADYDEHGHPRIETIPSGNLVHKSCLQLDSYAESDEADDEMGEHASLNSSDDDSLRSWRREVLSLEDGEEYCTIQSPKDDPVTSLPLLSNYSDDDSLRSWRREVLSLEDGDDYFSVQSVSPPPSPYRAGIGVTVQGLGEIEAVAYIEDLHRVNNKAATSAQDTTTDDEESSRSSSSDSSSSSCSSTSSSSSSSSSTCSHDDRELPESANRTTTMEAARDDFNGTTMNEVINESGSNDNDLDGHFCFPELRFVPSTSPSSNFSTERDLVVAHTFDASFLASLPSDDSVTSLFRHHSFGGFATRQCQYERYSPSERNIDQDADGEDPIAIEVQHRMKRSHDVDPGDAAPVLPARVPSPDEHILSKRFFPNRSAEAALLHLRPFSSLESNPKAPSTPLKKSDSDLMNLFRTESAGENVIPTDPNGWQDGRDSTPMALSSPLKMSDSDLINLLSSFSDNAEEGEIPTDPTGTPVGDCFDTHIGRGDTTPTTPFPQLKKSDSDLIDLFSSSSDNADIPAGNFFDTNIDNGDKIVDATNEEKRSSLSVNSPEDSNIRQSECQRGSETASSLSENSTEYRNDTESKLQRGSHVEETRHIVHDDFPHKWILSANHLDPMAEVILMLNSQHSIPREETEAALAQTYYDLETTLHSNRRFFEKAQPIDQIDNSLSFEDSEMCSKTSCTSILSHAVQAVHCSDDSEQVEEVRSHQRTQSLQSPSTDNSCGEDMNSSPSWADYFVSTRSISVRSLGDESQEIITLQDTAPVVEANWSPLLESRITIKTPIEVAIAEDKNTEEQSTSVDHDTIDPSCASNTENHRTCTLTLFKNSRDDIEVYEEIAAESRDTFHATETIELVKCKRGRLRSKIISSSGQLPVSYSYSKSNASISATSSAEPKESTCIYTSTSRFKNTKIGAKSKRVSTDISNSVEKVLHELLYPSSTDDSQSQIESQSEESDGIMLNKYLDLFSVSSSTSKEYDTLGLRSKGTDEYQINSSRSCSTNSEEVISPSTSDEEGFPQPYSGAFMPDGLGEPQPNRETSLHEKVTASKFTTGDVLARCRNAQENDSEKNKDTSSALISSALVRYSQCNLHSTTGEVASCVLVPYSKYDHQSTRRVAPNNNAKPHVPASRGNETNTAGIAQPTTPSYSPSKSAILRCKLGGRMMRPMLLPTTTLFAPKAGAFSELCKPNWSRVILDPYLKLLVNELLPDRRCHDNISPKRLADKTVQDDPASNNPSDYEFVGRKTDENIMELQLQQSLDTDPANIKCISRSQFVAADEDDGHGVPALCFAPQVFATHSVSSSEDDDSQQSSATNGLQDEDMDFIDGITLSIAGVIGEKELSKLDPVPIPEIFTNGHFGSLADMVQEVHLINAMKAKAAITTRSLKAPRAVRSPRDKEHKLVQGSLVSQSLQLDENGTYQLDELRKEMEQEIENISRGIEFMSKCLPIKEDNTTRSTSVSLDELGIQLDQEIDAIKRDVDHMNLTLPTRGENNTAEVLPTPEEFGTMYTAPKLPSPNELGSMYFEDSRRSGNAWFFPDTPSEHGEQGLDDEISLVTDADLKALMIMTKNGSDLSQVIPTLDAQPSEDDCSDYDGLEDELFALEEIEDELRQELAHVEASMSSSDGSSTVFLQKFLYGNVSIDHSIDHSEKYTSDEAISTDVSSSQQYTSSDYCSESDSSDENMTPRRVRFSEETQEFYFLKDEDRGVWSFCDYELLPSIFSYALNQFSCVLGCQRESTQDPEPQWFYQSYN